MDLETLKFPLCLKCGKTHETEGYGLWEKLANPCATNNYTYTILTGAKMMAILNGLFGSPIDDFEQLLQFESFRKMKNFDTATVLEKKAFLYEREADYRTYQRLSHYIQREKEFYGKIQLAQW